MDFVVDVGRSRERETDSGQYNESDSFQKASVILTRRPRTATTTSTPIGLTGHHYCQITNYHDPSPYSLTFSSNPTSTTTLIKPWSSATTFLVGRSPLSSFRRTFQLGERLE